MGDLPFDRVNIGLRERPVSGDINRAQSQIYRTITDLMMALIGGGAGNQRSGFIGNSFAVTPASPAAMSVQVTPGIGFDYNPTDVPTNIGATDLESVDDVSAYKPWVLNNTATFGVPTAPTSPNTRIDIIEIANSAITRQLIDSLPRFQLDTVTQRFLSHSFYKTLTYSVDGFTGQVTTPSSSVAPLSYKVGAPGNPGVAPPTTPGYTVLAQIAVGSGVTSIVSSNVTDERSLLTGGRYLGRQTFLTSGTYTPTPGTIRARAIIQAPGGGSGGLNAGSTSNTSGAGGGGECIEADVTSAGGITGGAVTLGAAGAAGAIGGNGGNGGNASMVLNGSTYTANGGSGGVAGLGFGSYPSFVAGGAPGSGGSGVSFGGGAPTMGAVASSTGVAAAGNGGDSKLGFGGQGEGPTPNPPTGFGGGAGGVGVQGGAGSGHVGYAGGPAYAYVDEWGV